MIRFVEETGSTNADLVARLKSAEFVPEGEWLVARRQASGRGRQGRDWFDGAGNFMGSSVVHRHVNDPAVATLALLAGLATYEAVLPYCPDPIRLMLKWPNDVMLGGAKLAGILLEGAGDAVVIGIGVNLRQAPDVPGRPTAALADIGPAPAPEQFARDIAHSFDQELQRWRQFGLEPLFRRWAAAGHPTGTPVSVHDSAGEQISGEFAGLDHGGALLMRLADGSTRVIHAGDVTLG